MWHWFPGFAQGNFCAGINFHVFDPKSNCNWNIFDKRYPLCEVAFIRRGLIKFLKLLGVYYRVRSKKKKRTFIGGFTLSYMVWLSGGLWYNFARSRAILFEKVKCYTLCANDKWQASHCMLPPTYMIYDMAYLPRFIYLLYFLQLKAFLILPQNKHKSVI